MIKSQITLILDKYINVFYLELSTEEDDFFKCLHRTRKFNINFSSQTLSNTILHNLKDAQYFLRQNMCKHS